MLIVPQEYLCVPLHGKNPTLKHLGAVMTHLQSSIGSKVAGAGDKVDSTLREVLRQLCRNILAAKAEEGASPKARDAALGPVAVVATFLGDASLFRVAADQTHEVWETGSYSALGKLVDLQALTSGEMEM